MNSFIQRHRDVVIGQLNGFDRLRFRGSKRLLCNVGGMLSYLWQIQVLLKDFKDYGMLVTEQLRQATVQVAQAAGVADLHRRAEVCQAANERYLESMASVQAGQALGELAEPLCRPIRWKGQRVRAINPLSGEDAALLAAVARGEFTLTGFRNRDLRGLLFKATSDPVEKRRQSGRVTRLIRLLRAHCLIRKLPHTHRYVLSANGQKTIAALLSARQADTAKLLDAA